MRFLLLAMFSWLCSCKTGKDITNKSKKPVKTETISIDFADLNNSIIKRSAPRGSFVVLEIINFNRILYTAVINNSQTNNFITEPGIFKMLKPSTGKDVTTETFTTETSGSSFSGGSMPQDLKEAAKNLSDQKNELKEQLTLFEETLPKYQKIVTVLKNAVRAKNAMERRTKDCSGNITEIISGANKQALDFIRDNQNSDQRIPDSSHASIDAAIFDLTDNAQTKATELYGKLKEIASKIQELAPALKSGTEKLAEALNAMEEGEQEDIEKFRANREAQLLILGSMNDKAKRDVKKVTEIMKAADQSNSFVETYINTNEAQKLLDTYAFFSSNNFILKSVEQLRYDELVFDVKIDPTKAGTVCQNMPIQSLHAPIKVRARGGFKLDFSSGFFLNFGKKDFFNQTYRLDPVEGDAENYQIVKNKNRNKVMPTLGALLHGYFRTGTDVQPAVSLGLSLGAGETTRLNYHFGLSILLGSEQRLVASFGWTLGAATVLDGKYEEGQKVLKSEAPQTVPTSSVNRWGNFIALSYNLTK